MSEDAHARPRRFSVVDPITLCETARRRLACDLSNCRDPLPVARGMSTSGVPLPPHSECGAAEALVPWPWEDHDRLLQKSARGLTYGCDQLSWIGTVS